MKNILKTVCVIIGTIIGAGFASGQEVYIFFFSHGIKGLIGIIISSVIIGLIIYISLKIIKYENIQNYDEFLKNLIRNKKIKDFADILINIFILISFYIIQEQLYALFLLLLHLNVITQHLKIYIHLNAGPF